MIVENILRLKEEIPNEVKLIAISKTKPTGDIIKAYNSGHIFFGENKIQEMGMKFEKLPKDIKWHMVGHVQSNKIKYMASYVDLVHGIDSLKSLKVLNKEGEKNKRVIDCLLQLKLSDEDSKFGLDEKKFKEIIYSSDYDEMKFVKIKGLMGMASFTSDQKKIENEFKFGYKIYSAIKKNDQNINILSMGMSNDYKLAIECGSNMIRIGSIIFGERNYQNIYSIIDIETTGGKFNEEKITEIAIFKISNDGEILKFHSLVNPERKIQPFVEKLTGINNKMVANMPVFLELANNINKFTKDTIFVAHNVGFDYRVIKKEFSRIGIEFQRKLLCTIELSKIVYPELKSYSLGKIASNLNIKIKNRHRADGDAMATLILFNKLRERLGEQKLTKFVKNLE